MKKSKSMNMYIKSFTLLFLFFVFGQTKSIATSTSFNPSNHSQIAQGTEIESSETTTTLARWIQQDTSTNRISFPTRAGFVLLRKEEIISLSINKLYGGILLQFWKNGEVKKVHCQTTIANALERLGEFPFVRVSRSGIVNMDQLSEYVGTRRDAHLLMTDGSMVKVSRNRAGEVYDWVAGMA